MISVITPVYNGEKFIESCIKAVIDQACPNVEHIIVDGCSKDKTVEIIKQYSERYPHIRWVSEKDKGQSDAINKGIALAKGDIIGILNVDDFYEPNVLCRISEMFKTLAEPSFLVGNCNILEEDDEVSIINKPQKLNLLDIVSMSSPFPVNPSAYFYHKSLHQKIGFYEIDEYYVMDIDFIFKAIQEANVKYIDETWGNFRLIKGTKTFTAMNNDIHLNNLRRIFRKYIKKLPLLQRWQAIFAMEVWSRIRYFSQNPQELYNKIKLKLNKTRMSQTSI